MLDQAKAAYTNYKWLRLAAGVGVLGCAVLLYWLSGGFPPWAWRLLFRVLPDIPRLWQLQSFALLLPLIGLVLLSTALLILWGALVVASVKVVQHWWYDFREIQHFAMDVQAAEHLTEQMAAEEMQQLATASPQQAYVVAHAARGPTSSTKTMSLPPTAVRQAEYRVQPTPATALSPPPTSIRGQLRLVPRVEDEQVSDEDEQDDTLPGVGLLPQREPSYLEVGVGLHPGFQHRDAPNEDYLFAIRGTHTTRRGLQHVGLFVVADGMGGQGQEASRLAIQAITAVVVPALLSDAKVIFADLLKEGVCCANLAIYRHNREQRDSDIMPATMATTMTAALVVGSVAYIANVGDSRTYLYRKSDGLSQITLDHSQVARLMEDSSIAPEEMYTHPQRSPTDRYLGRHASVEVDSFVVPLQLDDVLLLCSGGLWKMVSDATIEDIIQSSTTPPSHISTALVQTALNCGGAENISVVVARCLC